MAQAANRRVAFDRPAVDVGLRDFLRHVFEAGFGHLAETDEPAGRLRRQGSLTLAGRRAFVRLGTQI
jgi:hypothetical protein